MGLKILVKMLDEKVGLKACIKKSSKMSGHWGHLKNPGKQTGLKNMGKNKGQNLDRKKFRWKVQAQNSRGKTQHKSNKNARWTGSPNRSCPQPRRKIQGKTGQKSRDQSLGEKNGTKVWWKTLVKMPGENAGQKGWDKNPQESLRGKTREQNNRAKSTQRAQKKAWVESKTTRLKVSKKVRPKI